VTQYFHPDEESSTGMLLTDLAVELHRRGWKVDVVAGQPMYHRAGPRLPTTGEHEGVIIRRVWSTRLPKDIALGRVLNSLTLAVSMGAHMLMRPERNPVMVVTCPPVLQWIGGMLDAARNVRVIHLVHDVYPDIAVKLGYLRAGGLVARVWEALTRWSLRRARAVISLGYDMTEKLKATLPASCHGRLYTIENFADGDLIRPMPREGHPVLRELGLEKKFVIQYAGNIGRHHDIETVVRAARALKGTRAHFLFIGSGGRAGEIKEAVRRYRLGNITLLPFQPRQLLGRYLTACDAGLATMHENVLGLCVSSKLYGILASGRPVIGLVPEGSQVERTILENGVGAVVRPGDADKLIETIQQWMKDGKAVDRMSRRARETFERHYTVGAAARRYERVLLDLVEVPGVLNG